MAVAIEELQFTCVTPTPIIRLSAGSVDLQLLHHSESKKVPYGTKLKAGIKALMVHPPWLDLLKDFRSCSSTTAVLWAVRRRYAKSTALFIRSHCVPSQLA